MNMDAIRSAHLALRYDSWFWENVKQVGGEKYELLLLEIKLLLFAAADQLCHYQKSLIE